MGTSRGGFRYHDDQPVANLPRVRHVAIERFLGQQLAFGGFTDPCLAR